MRSTGLFETAPSFDAGEVVNFPFQAFSEHLVIARLLDRHASDADKLHEAAVQEIADHPAFWRSAAVLLPERYGVELVDAIDVSHDDWRLREVTLNSLVDRDPTAFGERALELLEDAFEDQDFRIRAYEAVFVLAPRLDHPCNALWLHKRLLALSMPERDASWSVATFDVLEASDSFRRLLHWAIRGDDRTDDEQVVLAALPLVWVLTSSNRRLRDHTTKALVELLRHRLPALHRLLTLCERVDDPYVTERLLLIAYGSIMRGGDLDTKGAGQVTSEVLRWFTENLMPVHVLARDAGRGVVTWATNRGLLEVSAAASVTPPYGSHAPEEPSSAEDLEASYGFIDGDPPQWRCSAILCSCLNWMGDFNKYVIAGDVGRFSLHPLSGPAPTQSAHKDPLGKIGADWAGRWVAWKAIHAGWTTERFGEFERSRNLTSGRAAHKPERFGKKYQWLALHELLARLADNFHPSVGDSSTRYEGPWNWFGRDLDPSLACSTMSDGQLIPKVALDDGSDGWLPIPPDMKSDQSPQEWAHETSDFPATKGLVLHVGPSRAAWVAIYRYSNWTRRPERSSRWGWDRQQWILQLSWLARAGTGSTVFDLLCVESLFGRWMPERGRPHRAYLGEGPWSHLDAAEPPVWENASKRWDDPEGIPVLPATETYLWEGNTLDCSLDETVSFQVPTGLLLGDARWTGTHPEWLDGDGVVTKALRTREGHMEHTILLARSNWLASRLVSLELELVIGVLGERQSMDDSDDMDLRAWTEFTSVGLWIPGNEWTFADPNVQTHTKDGEAAGRI